MCVNIISIGISIWRWKLLIFLIRSPVNLILIFISYNLVTISLFKYHISMIFLFLLNTIVRTWIFLYFATVLIFILLFFYTDTWGHVEGVGGFDVCAFEEFVSGFETVFFILFLSLSLSLFIVIIIAVGIFGYLLFVDLFLDIDGLNSRVVLLGEYLPKFVKVITVMLGVLELLEIVVISFLLILVLLLVLVLVSWKFIWNLDLFFDVFMNEMGLLGLFVVVSLFYTVKFSTEICLSLSSSLSVSLSKSLSVHRSHITLITLSPNPSIIAIHPCSLSPTNLKTTTTLCNLLFLVI